MKHIFILIMIILILFIVYEQRENFMLVSNIIDSNGNVVDFEYTKDSLGKGKIIFK